MLELITRLLVALTVAVGAHGVTTAGAHATPAENAHVVAAIEATIARVAAVVNETSVIAAEAASGTKPDATGLDRANEVANEHAADGLAKAAAAGSAGRAKAAAASSAGRAKAAAARAAHPAASGADAGPPFDVPPVDGPPATHPPVPAPPVDAPGLDHRP